MDVVKTVQDSEGDRDPHDVALLTKTDIWVDHILPFLGPGYFVFVAGVCRQLKELHKSYFASIKQEELPMVHKQCISWTGRRKTSITDTFSRAAFSSVSCAKYWQKNLNKGQNPCAERVCYVAAQTGNLEVMQWVHKQGFRWDELACCAAASEGHLEILKYLHDNGCPWDERAFNCAAEPRRLVVLTYLKENGCPQPQMYYCRSQQAWKSFASLFIEK